MPNAVVVSRFGGPEVMRLEPHDVGLPGPGQIALRQTAIGVNLVDTYQRSGLHAMPLPFVPGNDGAGVVIAVGPGVTLFKPGDRVAYSGGLGGYSTERLIDTDKVVGLPAEIGDQTAAAVMLKGLTAYVLLREVYRVGPETTMLYHAAAGGVGLVAVQWAKALGATVIGTAGSAKKIELLRQIGCDHAFDYLSEDFAARVHDFTDGRGVDVVYDGVGKATFERSLTCLKPRGLMVSFGNASGVVGLPDVGILSKGSVFLTRPSTADYLDSRAAFLRAANALFDAIQSGTIEVRVDAIYPLARAADAHRALESRRTTGSVLLLP